MSSYFSDEVVVHEDVGRASQHGVRRGVLSLGLQEGMSRQAWHTGVVEVRTKVHQSHSHLEICT